MISSRKSWVLFAYLLGDSNVRESGFPSCVSRNLSHITTEALALQSSAVAVTVTEIEILHCIYISISRSFSDGGWRTFQP